MSDEQKKFIKARLDEIKGITESIKLVLDEDDEQPAQQQQEGPSDPPPNPPGGGNG